MRAIIMADGSGTRWGNHRGTPKHLVEIDGETLLQRTVRLLRARGVEDIYITSHDPRYEVEGAKRYEPENNVFEVDKFLSPRPIWAEETALIYGDVYFSEAAIDAIVRHEPDHYSFFGRSTASRVTGKRYKEVFALKFTSHPVIATACQSVREFVARGGTIPSLKEPVGGAWHLYLELTGHQAGDGERDHFIEINDITEDFDYPEDLEKWLNLTATERGNVAPTSASVMVAIPNLGSIHPKLVSCLLRWSTMPTSGVGQVGVLMPEGQIPHDSARNFTVQRFLESSATHLFFIDADVVPPFDALEKLIAADRDVITGLYPSMRFNPNTSQIEKINNVFCYGTDAYGLSGLLPVQKAEGVVPVDRCGGGCLLIKREVLEKVGAPWFKFQYDDFGVMHYGEDIDFCKKAEAAGYQLYAHGGVQCGHKKDILL